MTPPPSIEGFDVRPLGDDDVAALEALFDEDPEYFEINGRRTYWSARGGTVIRLGVVEPNLKARHPYATEGFEFEAMREIDVDAKRMRRTLVLRRAL